MDNEKILTALRMAIETNRYTIGETEITILPTELVIIIYNLLSEKEKLAL